MEINVYPANAIANYILDKGDIEDIPITPMQVLKLTYILHGWCLGVDRAPLIKEKVKAWEYGPVIPEVYYEFRDYRDNPISGRAYDGSTRYKFDDSIPFSSNHKMKEFLTAIWDAYKDYSGLELSSMTHKVGTPWYHTKRKHRWRINPTIKNDLIQDYYRKLYEKQKSQPW